MHSQHAPSRTSMSAPPDDLLRWWEEEQCIAFPHEEIPSAEALPFLTEQMGRVYDSCTDPNEQRYPLIRQRYLQLQTAHNMLVVMRQIAGDSDTTDALFDKFFRGKSITAEALHNTWSPVLTMTHTLNVIAQTSQAHRKLTRALLALSVLR